MKTRYLFIPWLILCTSFNSSSNKKINGVSFVSSSHSIDQSNVRPIVKINANYAAIIPFAFNRNLNDPNIQFNSDHQWFGETAEGISQYSKEFKTSKIKLMMKPQIWVWGGEYSGDIKMTSETKWIKLEKSYTKFILHFAKLSEKLNIEIFCIGTEMDAFRTNRPSYWIGLIKKIRKEYSGKITYAANWDEYKRVQFWKELDYIGVDAYFPLSNNKTPTESDCREGWKNYKQSLKDLSISAKKQVLFTEFGYTSSDSTAMEPWRSDRKKVNLLGQLNATTVIFDEFWSESWFAGGFIWKWFPNHSKSGGIKNAQFTPQNKPVENLIRKRYKE